MNERTRRPKRPATCQDVLDAPPHMVAETIRGALHFDADMLVPDIAGRRRERSPALPDTAGIDAAPDWACEASPPSTRTHDRSETREISLERGVAHPWLVDPQARRLAAVELAPDADRRPA